MKKQRRPSFFLLFSMLLCFTSFSYSGITGKISGRIMDAETNEPLFGVNIVIHGTHMGTTTGSDGRFVLLNLPPGRFSISVQMMGYEHQKIENIRVSVDYTTRLDVKLVPTILEGKTVYVTAKRPLIQKDLTSSTASISEQRISELPAEEVEEFIKLQAGVTVDPQGSIHIRGGRSTEIAYLIDGVPVTDGFDHSQAIKVENSGIQELQVISGTFNAEYGQAQSGVVNIITRKGSSRLDGEISVWTGDYLSQHKDLFYALDELDPVAEKNMTAKLSGPIPLIDATFFIFGRASTSDGWLYGKREFVLPDTFDVTDGYTTYNSTSHTGDSTFVPMNDFERYSLQSNLSISSFRNFPISYSFFYNHLDKKAYDHRFARLPEGDASQYERSLSHMLNLKYIFSPRTFLSVSYSYFFKKSDSYLFDNEMDYRYLFPAISTEQIFRRFSLEGLEYVTDQTNNEHYFIQNRTQIGKIDFTSQLHPIHLIKTGVEVKKYQLDYEYYEVVDQPGNKVQNVFYPYVDADNTVKHDNFQNTPLEAAGYLQDKIEFHEIIVNAGLRFDYFDSHGEIPSDLTEKTSNILSAPRVAATAKIHWSPRFGLAFPYSDRGVIHFSYGHFTQIPDFKSLFWNSEYEIRLGGLATIVGNPDLEPEKTISWELGVQHQLFDDTGLYATLYFKDIKNLLGQEIISLKGGQAYSRYINRDYGNVRGFIIAVEKRMTDLFAVNVDYTFQKAKGNASDPFAVFTDNQGSPPRESEKQVQPLNWDQRHTINASATFADPGKWGLSVIMQYGSGLPYTPTDPDRSLRIAFENSERKPPTYNVDLLAHYDLQLLGFAQSVFIKAYNLLDVKNEIDVFTDTGRATYTHALNYQLGDRRPDYFSRPRLIMAGLKFQLRNENH